MVSFGQNALSYLNHPSVSKSYWTKAWLKAWFGRMLSIISPRIAYLHDSDIINTLRRRWNYHNFADEIFKCISVNENVWISIKISLKFVTKVLINDTPALVQKMAWRRSGDKPLSELMMVSLLTHICVTRLRWVKSMFEMKIPTWLYFMKP